MIDLNATRAAIPAGYSTKTANKIGSENLAKPDIASEIARRQKKLADLAEDAAELAPDQAEAIIERTGLTDGEAIRELYRLIAENRHEEVETVETAEDGEGESQAPAGKTERPAAAEARPPDEAEGVAPEAPPSTEDERAATRIALEKNCATVASSGTHSKKTAES